MMQAPAEFDNVLTRLETLEILLISLAALFVGGPLVLMVQLHRMGATLRGFVAALKRTAP